MVRSGSYNHGSVRDSGFRKFLERCKNGNFTVETGCYLASALGIGIYYGGQRAFAGFVRQFLNMQGVDLAHPAHTGDS